MLQLSRTNDGGNDSARAYKIFIDGIEVGDIRKGETKCFDLNEGFHSLQLKIDWCSSKAESFVVEKGKTIYAECSPCKKGVFGTLFSTFVTTDDYINLKINNQ